MNGAQALTPGAYWDLGETFIQMVEDRMAPPPSIRLKNWVQFDKLTGGFRMHEFSILCGPTGSGKTTFLANLSAQLADTEARQFIMSVETGARDYMARVSSTYSGYDLNTGDAVPESVIARMASVQAKILARRNMFFALYEDRVSVEQIMCDIEHQYLTNKTNIVFIDNLNYLLEVKRSNDAIIEMDRVVHSLIVFIKRLPIHIVMVMHPRKTDGGRVLSEFDIKGSATAVQEAQNVFLLNRPKPEKISDGTHSKFDRELKIAKMRRRGQYAGNYIVFENKGSRWVDGERIYDEYSSNNSGDRKGRSHWQEN